MLHSDQLVDARLRRLAKEIETLAGKDESALQYSREDERGQGRGKTSEQRAGGEHRDTDHVETLAAEAV